MKASTQEERRQQRITIGLLLEKMHAAGAVHADGMTSLDPALNKPRIATLLRLRCIQKFVGDDGEMYEVTREGRRRAGVDAKPGEVTPGRLHVSTSPWDGKETMATPYRPGSRQALELPSLAFSNRIFPKVKA